MYDEAIMVEQHRAVFRPRYWMIPTILADNPLIEPFDEKVYAAVDWFHGMKDGECRASNQSLAELIKPHDPQPRSVQNSLTRLEECGYIRREYKDKEKRNRLRIIPLIELHIVRKRDDTHKTNEAAMIIERTVDDTHERNGDDQSKNKQSNKRSKIHTAQSADEEKQIGEIIFAFKEVNPSYKTLFNRPPQREAAFRLMEQHGFEKLTRMIAYLPHSNAARYAPTITTPSQLESKLGELISWGQKQRSGGSGKGKGIISTVA